MDGSPTITYWHTPERDERHYNGTLVMAVIWLFPVVKNRKVGQAGWLINIRGIMLPSDKAMEVRYAVSD